jgi:hypothetical protein
MDKEVLHFKSINKLASKLMMTVAKILSESNVGSKNDSRIDLANFCQELAEKYMHFERIKKIILDFFNKSEDDRDYNLDEEQADKLVQKVMEEIRTIMHIELAAQDKIDMAWDSEKQDFVFKNKEDDEDVSDSCE